MSHLPDQVKWTCMIAEAYSAEDARSVVEWKDDRSVVEGVARIAFEIQDSVEARPGECRYWTSLWVIRVRNELGLPAVQVGGDLFAFGECVYCLDDVSQFTDPNDQAFEARWPGHSWLVLGSWIGDISITITSLAPDCQRSLLHAVNRHFKRDRGLVRVPLFSASTAGSFNLEYVPKGVFSEAAMVRNVEVGQRADTNGELRDSVPK